MDDSATAPVDDIDDDIPFQTIRIRHSQLIAGFFLDESKR